MKKILPPILVFMTVLSLAACGGKASDNSVPTDNVSTEESSGEEKETTQKEPETEKDEAESGSLEKLAGLVEKDVNDTIAALADEYEQLKTDIDTYDKYIQNIDKVEAFYANVYETQKALSIRLREYSLDYAELIISTDSSNDDKYDDLEELYDTIYDGCGDEIYDEIYDGILDDIYDDFYDGILDDAYDTVPYKDWSDARSNEYEWWSDTRSDVYEDWSDLRSDVYEFWSDMRSEIWDDDIERAKEKMADFEEDILKESDVKKEETSSETEEPSETVDETIAEDDPGLVDGMRPEFKAAMDSYEAFYDEYCEFMKEYKANPTDIKLLAEYSDMAKKLVDMDEAFKEWESNDLNDEELKYYIDVSSRIAQKLLDVAE